MEQCCETPILPGKYDKGSALTFSGLYLGECNNRIFDINEPIQATITMPSSGNGWGGSSIHIHTINDVTLHCPVDTWIDTDKSTRLDYSKSFRTDCDKGEKLSTVSAHIECHS